MQHKIDRTPKLILLAVCALSAYATGTASKEPEPIPARLIPPGFIAADCHITKPGAPITDEDADGHPRTIGHRDPTVICSKRTPGPTTEVHRATCRSEDGKEFPLEDCCLSPDGSRIQACEPKPQPAGQ